MKTHARVIVIGGGVVGVSTLYHLAKKGWSDVALLERKELTSGSTWHAAGLLPLFNMSYSVGQLHKYSVSLYESLGKETGQEIGLKQVSNIRLARTEDRMDEYKFYAGVAETIGVDVRFLTPSDLFDIWPLCVTEDIVGAIQHPRDGYVQPADLTQALATGARNNGAEIYRNTNVKGIERTNNGEWKIITDTGTIICEHIVSASGNFARKTGSMVGIDIPVIPIEHQYLVTEPHPKIVARREAGEKELGVLRESDSSWYMREENGGLLLGPYEVGAPCCYIDGPATESEYELFQEDIDRLLPHIETAVSRVPAFAEVGIKQVYNGAIPYTPDGSPIVGPAWDLPNFWLNEGHSFGITAAGGAGWQLAEWIIEGEPSIDMMGVDPRRFGSYATLGYLQKKNEEAYANVFSVHYPDEERSVARPLKRSPCYERMASLGAVFGSIYGWERPNWFAPKNYKLTNKEISKPDILLNETCSAPDDQGHRRERWSFRRSNYFEYVGRECKHVNKKVGLLDMSPFAKFKVSGRDAALWLEGLVANRIPKEVGRIALCHMLTPAGGVRSEFTVYKSASEEFYIVSAGAYERHDYDYLLKSLPDNKNLSLQNVTTQYGVLVLAGPDSRRLLQKITETNLGNTDFKWLTGKFINVGCAQAHALRVNFVGELGWELHHPIEMQSYIFDLIMEAGKEFEIKPFGIRAMDSLRLEKSYRLIPRELSIEYSAFDSGLHRFVKLENNDFIGSKALKTNKKQPDWGYVTLEIHNIENADARGSEPIRKDGKLVGRATSGGYGWRVNKSLALAMIQFSLVEPGAEFEITILGKPHKATIIPDSPFDPDNECLRS